MAEAPAAPREENDMAIPAPRPPADDAADHPQHNPPQRDPQRDLQRDPERDPQRERFQDAIMSLYDRLREASRAQCTHAARMMETDLGGTLWVQIPSKAAKRTLPEAGFISEGPTGVRIG